MQCDGLLAGEPVTPPTPSPLRYPQLRFRRIPSPLRYPQLRFRLITVHMMSIPLWLTAWYDVIRIPSLLVDAASASQASLKL